jgi:hypothetical protein
MAKLNFQVQSRIDNVDGKVLIQGDVIVLDDKVAEPFVKTGSLVQTEAPVALVTPVAPSEKTKESGKGEK